MTEQERRLSEKLESALAIYEGEDCEPTLGDVREWRDRAAELEAELDLHKRALSEACRVSYPMLQLDPEDYLRSAEAREGGGGER